MFFNVPVGDQPGDEGDAVERRGEQGERTADGRGVLSLRRRTKGHARGERGRQVSRNNMIRQI